MEGNNNEAEKEPKPSCCTRFKTSMHNARHYLYNPDTKEVLGRSGISWLKIAAFYIGFYAVLAAFWATCMVGFIRTLDGKAPTMQKMFSMMKDNPGMNYDPFPEAANSTMIVFNKDDPSTYKAYVDKLTSVYEKYLEYLNKTDPYTVQKDCSDSNRATSDVACRYYMDELENSSCSPDNSFGYSEGRPCVLLRINRVYLWEPNGATFDDANKCADPSDKTKDTCKNQIEFMAIRKEVKSQIIPRYISVSCEGENEGDIDNINKVTFYPGGGFPAYFYPFYNQKNYTSPPVMAQFDVVPGRVSLILCQVWTRDIIHDKYDLQGSIHFELMYDEKKH